MKTRQGQTLDGDLCVVNGGRPQELFGLQLPAAVGILEMTIR